MSEKRNTVTKSAKQSPQIINSFKCVFPARSVNEGFARTVVSAFVSQLDPTVSEMSDLKTAVSEAVTNSIVHGYKDKNTADSLIYLTAKRFSDNVVVVEIKDKGCGIPDVRQALEPMFTTSPSEERSGMGFTVMSSFCDKIKVSSAVGKGTTVILEKRFSST
jgi:stage II sporulation protein AB (anti-sigma F factor)